MKEQVQEVKLRVTTNLGELKKLLNELEEITEQIEAKVEEINSFKLEFEVDY